MKYLIAILAVIFMTVSVHADTIHTDGPDVSGPSTVFTISEGSDVVKEGGPTPSLNKWVNFFSSSNFWWEDEPFGGR